ncbi:helicase-related protein, partial [Cohnella lubricantis]
CGRSGCAVCEACAALGRSRECGLLVLGPEPSEQPMALAPGAAMDRWGLSPAQQDASAAAVRFLRENALRAAEAATAAERSRRPDASRRPHRYTAEAAIYRPRSPAAAVRRRLLSLGSTAVQRISGLSGNDAYSHSFLLWAVTGAGKTEMIFPLLDAVLRGGGRALVATPRRDVVLELAPRLAKAFPDYSRAVLYGGSEDRWANADLTLATTHQLMRFQGAFDLVLIDELDAFPYHNDPLLHHAAAKSRKPAGAAVLLSATPPASMQRAVKRGRLSCARVPVRYHRHPLPVPGRIPLPPLHRWAGQSKGKLPAALGKQLKHSAARNAQLFVFVPYIRHVQPLVDLLRREAGRLGLDPAAIGGTSSTDPDRAAKVGAFRRAGLRLLVTTTILERGVTIPRSDVFILDAHHAMFNEAALVQMAGRAGRSGDDPNGRVFFCAAYRTSFQRGAERQIRMMNRIARRRGYLLTEGAAQ